MAYIPKPSPLESAQFQAWVRGEIEAIAREWLQPQQFLMLDTLHAQPKKFREGTVVLADGSDWDPGSGAGVYVYRGGAWHFLG